MSAEVRVLALDEVFWFRQSRRFHAFGLINGDLEQTSICGTVDINLCDDFPTIDIEERHGNGCTFCLTGVVHG